MKWLCFLIIFSMAVVISLNSVLAATNQTNQTTCTDSDGGLVYTLKGTMNHGTSQTDSCENSKDLLEWSCTNSGSSQLYDCTSIGSNYRCSNGACVIQSNTTTNTTAQCTDSDGNNSLIRGTTQNASFSFTDICSSTYEVKEGLCLGSLVTYSYNICSPGYTCSNGACVQNVTVSCNESGYVTNNIADDVLGYNVRVLFLTQNSIKLGVGAFNTTILSEGSIYRLPDGTLLTIYDIIYSDISGEGGAIFGLSRCGENVTAQCTDSDGGLNYNVRGNTANLTTNFTDSCENSRDLLEWSCVSGGGSTSQLYDCTSLGKKYRCQNGACAILRASPSEAGFFARFFCSIFHPFNKEKRTSCLL